ncbi:MAG: sigma-70 family RNA polymerase sigma factor [Actinomycetia bacterium]|nr:sigma-70 family RNA polymerase sigma factor [Actinomycetes bacterium]
MGVSDFDAFYESERTRLIRLCWLLTLDREVAAELAQETMARAWRDWESIETSIENPAGWLTRVAVNLCSNQRRGWGTARRWRHLIATPDRSPAPTEFSDLHRALDSLPARQRQAVVLRYWDDLDVAGCALVMGVSEGSVKQHLSRAREALRKSNHLVEEES